MNTMGRLILAGAVLGRSADSGLAQAPKPVTPDLARLSDGKSAQVFNHHARIVVVGGRVEVYVNGAEKPSLAVADLGAAKSGGVALFVGNGSDGAFADLRVTVVAPAGPPPDVAYESGQTDFVTWLRSRGGDADAAGLRAYRDTLKAAVDIIRTNRAAGRTAEQMVRDDVLAAYEPRYSLLEFLTPDAWTPQVVTALQQGTLK